MVVEQSEYEKLQIETEGPHQNEQELAWIKPAWWKRKRKQEEDKGGEHKNLNKRPRLHQETPEWGKEVPDRTKYQKMFFTSNLGITDGDRKTKFKQQKFRIPTEAEKICLPIANELVVVAAAQGELGNRDENQVMNMAFSLVESGVDQLVSNIIDCAATRMRLGLEKELNKTGPSKTRQKKAEYEYGARALVRYLADQAVGRVEWVRLWQPTPNPNKLERKKLDKADLPGRELNTNTTQLRKTSIKTDSRAPKSKVKKTKVSILKQNKIKNENILPISRFFKVKVKVDQISQNCSNIGLNTEGGEGGQKVIRNKRKRQTDNETGREAKLLKGQGG